MIDRPNISDRESQRRASQRAMTVRCFCESVGIGRTRFYREVKAGRLRVRKVGRRTIVTSDDADQWLNRLPAINQVLDEAAS
jgi:excisionase family DNA binding protein